MGPQAILVKCKCLQTSPSLWHNAPLKLKVHWVISVNEHVVFTREILSRKLEINDFHFSVLVFSLSHGFYYYWTTLWEKRKCEDKQRSCTSVAPFKGMCFIYFKKSVSSYYATFGSLEAMIPAPFKSGYLDSCNWLYLIEMDVKLKIIVITNDLLSIFYFMLEH